MNKFKKAVALCLALCMAVLLVACGGSSSQGGSAAQGGSSDGTKVLEVKIWDNTQRDGLQEIADLYTEKTGVKVNIQVVTWDDYWTLLEAGASGGEMPDVFWMHSNNAQMYMENDKLLNLTDYLAGSSMIKAEDYYPGIMTLYSLDGKQYAVAKDHDTIALIYNKALFDKYGVDYPTDDWTWNDYYEAGKAITEAGKADGVYGAAMNTTNDQDGWYNIVYDYGGYIISEDHKKSGFDDPNTLKAMEFIGSLCSDVFAPQTLVSENGTDGLFNNSLAAMITQGSWMINSFYTHDNAENYAWAMLPYYDANGNGTADAGERCSIYNGLGWAASADTKYPDEAWGLIEWFSSKDMQQKQSDLGVTMSGMQDASVSEAFTQAFPGMDVSAFLKMETEGTLVFRPYSKRGSRWSDMYQKNLVAAWLDPSVMEATSIDIAAQMNAMLADE